MNEISSDLAKEIWQVLVDHAHASNDGVDQETFVQYATGLADIKEYRFKGALGFGGKVRLNHARWSVDCYPEDANPERVRMIEATNQALAELKDRAVDNPTCEDIDLIIPLVKELTAYQAQVFLILNDGRAGLRFRDAAALNLVRNHHKLIEDRERRRFEPVATARAIIEAEGGGCFSTLNE